jgi:hypothetical protein
LTDVQLYLAIGIPTFAILVGILTNVVHHSDNRVTRIEAKLGIG